MYSIFSTIDSSGYLSASDSEDSRLPINATQVTDINGQNHQSQTKIVKPKDQQHRQRISRSTRSDLLFSVSRVENQLRKGQYTERIGSTASVYLASVLEYLVAEMTELAGDITIKSNRKRITPRDIALAIKNDHELATLCSQVTIPGGGVQPFIHQALLKPRRHRR